MSWRAIGKEPSKSNNFYSWKPKSELNDYTRLVSRIKSLLIFSSADKYPWSLFHGAASNGWFWWVISIVTARYGRIISSPTPAGSRHLLLYYRPPPSFSYLVKLAGKKNRPQFKKYHLMTEIWLCFNLRFYLWRKAKKNTRKSQTEWPVFEYRRKSHRHDRVHGPN